MLTTDRLGGSALCLLAVFVMWESRRLPLGTWHNPGPGYFPVLLAVILFVLGGLVCAMGTHAAPLAPDVGRPVDRRNGLVHNRAGLPRVQPASAGAQQQRRSRR